MEMSGLISTALSSITGNIIQGNASMYALVLFLFMVFGVLIAYKLFHILMHTVSMGILFALVPFAINIGTGAVFGFKLFKITPNVILSFMFLGVIGIGTYKMVYSVVGVIENLIPSSSPKHHGGHKPIHNKPKKKSHPEPEEVEFEE